MDASEQKCCGDGKYEHKVWCHDKYLVDAKPQNQVDEHIEAKAGETEPQETASASAPDTNNEKQHYQSLHDITP